MQFDDRLATVLRMQAGNERAVNTQYRQLLDLAGSAPEGANDALLQQAFARLEVLSAEIEPHQRAAIIREPGMRLRNPELVAALAGQELPVASATMAAARLSEAQWNALIPALSIPARSLLRHRRDLPPRTLGLLARLGVADLVLPEPEGDYLAIAAAEDGTPSQSPPPMEIDPALTLAERDAREGIGALVRRIEAFRRAREQVDIAANDAPRLPLGEHMPDAEAPAPAASFDFMTDPDGRICWADGAFGAMSFGLLLFSAQPDAPARTDAATLLAARRRQPLLGHLVTIDGAPAISGEWRLDAFPQFSVPGGRFTGYRGRMRRPVAAKPATDAGRPDSPAERVRQILHELRTPVNAIQGFAEIIQQQLFGPTPNEYRALAASIAGDAARMLAGFDELDRLVKLESGALKLEDGSSDLQAIVARTVRQLDTVLRPRSAGLELSAQTAECLVGLVPADAEILVWRLLASLAGATAPGEALQILLDSDTGLAKLTIELPAALANRPDIFAGTPPAQANAVNAGMFGTGFTLRLARAEARDAGGDLSHEEDALTLALPLALDGQANNVNKDTGLGERPADTA